MLLEVRLMLKYFVLFLGFSTFSFAGQSPDVFVAKNQEQQFPNAKSTLKYNGKNGLLPSNEGSKEYDDEGSYSIDHKYNRPELEKECAGKECGCGLADVSIEKKIEDCQSHKIIKKYAKYLTWIMVSRKGATDQVGVFGKGREVWLDKDTKLLWSSRVSNAINWCKASGSDASFKDAFKICSQEPYQFQGSKTVSACSDDFKRYSPSPEIDPAGKVGIGLNSTPKVVWRLPTLNDYYRALANGLMHVVPDSKGSGTWEWSSTVFSLNKALAWDVSTQLGEVGNDDRRGYNAARCVADYTP